MRNLYARFELEDVIVDLLDNAEDKAKIKVRINRSFGRTTVGLSCMGKRIDHKTYRRQNITGQS